MSSPKLSTFHPPKILIVEGNPLLQKMLEGMVEVLGAKAYSTDDANEALRWFQENHYDLVLMDLYLWDSSGFELTQRMRENEPADTRIPIIGHATVAAPEEVQSLCLSAGMNSLSEKLASLDGMYRVLERWLSRPLVMPIHMLDVYVPQNTAA